MRLLNVRIRNFKLLEKVDIEFSNNVDYPLTVVRAENGSGKTSVLQALRWVLWGEAGIQKMALSSSKTPRDMPIVISVELIFETSNYYSPKGSKFCLIRQCKEIRKDKSKFHRMDNRVQLLALTNRGMEKVNDDVGTILNSILPTRLADVFFTDGKTVEKFAIESADEKVRLNYVSEAVQQLLSIERVSQLNQIAFSLSQKFKKSMVGSGSKELNETSKKLEKKQQKLSRVNESLNTIESQIQKCTEEIEDAKKQLESIKNSGSLNEIRERIRQLEDDVNYWDEEEIRVRTEIRKILMSEELSKYLLCEQIKVGTLKINLTLESNHVVPTGMKDVLMFVLESGQCICGDKISLNPTKQESIQAKVRNLQETDPRLDKLYRLQNKSPTFGGNTSTNQDDQLGSLKQNIEELKIKFLKCIEKGGEKRKDLHIERKKINDIDEPKVKLLASRIKDKEEDRNKWYEYKGEASERKSRILRDLQILERKIDELQEVEKLHEYSLSLTVYFSPKVTV